MDDLTLREGLTLVFMLIGTSFIVISAIGIIRMPDLFLRMSMTTKSSTLGVGSMMVAAAIFFGSDAASVQAVAIILFLLLTAPISAHLIARAGYGAKDVHAWERTRIDDLSERYDELNRTLSGHMQKPLKHEEDADPLGERR
ncbi:MAG: monovalent cation/H(+) antiporter subunit G [Anaerolineales bacterium]